ncbi:MAG: ADP-ribosylglycohydrolase family protein, partial [Oscillospiraceae bacterium]|nr:ADP-ribosylglycohydrolase family protein [Oscillospiraceae bacterium]
MYGAIIGDIAGSKYEFNSIKTKDFPFISRGCAFTDDTVMTVAVARALLQGLEENKPLKPLFIAHMQQLGKSYPYAGYGSMFSSWIHSKRPMPYNSFGNGSAMRVSPCGLIAVTLEEALELAGASAEVTHNHPEGIKGAQATAAAVFLAKTG